MELHYEGSSWIPAPSCTLPSLPKVAWPLKVTGFSLWEICVASTCNNRNTGKCCANLRMQHWAAHAFHSVRGCWAWSVWLCADFAHSFNMSPCARERFVQQKSPSPARVLRENGIVETRGLASGLCLHPFGLINWKEDTLFLFVKAFHKKGIHF